MTLTHVKPMNTETPAEMTVSAWRDPLVESLGYRPDSLYVEVVWLGVLGPSATWAWRHLSRLAADVEEATSQSWQETVTTVDMIDLAVTLGLGEGLGRNSQLSRTLARLESFGFVYRHGSDLGVRLAVGNVTEARARRLSLTARSHHQRQIGQ